MVESEADRRMLLAIEGEEVVISDGEGGAPLEVDDGAGGTRGPVGVLSYTHELVDVEASIASRDPILLVPEAEIPGVASGWSVTTSRGEFKVFEPPRHDGQGMSLLILTRPAPAPIP